MKKTAMLRQALHERFFVTLINFVGDPFALSSLRSGHVEGLSAGQMTILVNALSLSLPIHRCVEIINIQSVLYFWLK